MGTQITVTVELTDEEVLALAQFAKRCNWSDVRALAVDDAEAYRMRDAVDLLRAALMRVGYAPR